MTNRPKSPRGQDGEIQILPYLTQRNTERFKSTLARNHHRALFCR